MKLSPHQDILLRCCAASGIRCVTLASAGNWRTARSLVARGLGRTETDRTKFGAPIGFFFASAAGLAAIPPENHGDKA